MASGSQEFGFNPNETFLDASQEKLSLVQFLWRSPLIFNNRFNDEAKRAILQRLYQSLWDDDKEIMQQNYFDSEDDLFQDIDRIVKSVHGQGQRVETEYPTWPENNPAEVDLSHQRNRICGHVFEKNEPVYKCRTCRADEHCVLCSRCFHASDHKNHNYYVTLSPGAGGCCDCGDSESWKVPFKCLLHKSFLPTEFSNMGTSFRCMYRTAQAVFDFLLDIFALAPEATSSSVSVEDVIAATSNERHVLHRMNIPFRHFGRNVEQPLNHRGMDVDLDKENTFEPSLQPTMDDKENAYKSDWQPILDGEEYVCIVWNDENHAFTDVREHILLATGCSMENAKNMVETIHQRGRAVIATSTNIEELCKIGDSLAKINLGVTIRPAQDIFREGVCDLLLDWLLEVVTGRRQFFRNSEGDNTSQVRIIGDMFCASWELPLPLALFSASELWSSKDTDTHDPDEDTIMYEPEGPSTTQTHTHELSPSSSASSSPVIYRNQDDIASIDWEPAEMTIHISKMKIEEEAFYQSLFSASPSVEGAFNPAHKTKIPLPPPGVMHKQAESIEREFEEKNRVDYFLLYDVKLWKSIRIALRKLYIALCPRTYVKSTFGKRLTRNYARLHESRLLKTRELENSIAYITMQLFTSPQVAEKLVNRYFLFNIICTALGSLFLTDHLTLRSPRELCRLPQRINCESVTLRGRRCFNPFLDLRYLMSVGLIQQVIARDPIYLRQYIDLIALFQGMNAQVCQRDTHVEYESDVWANVFATTTEVAKTNRHFLDCYSSLETDTFANQVSSAQFLIGAANRILKKIVDWGRDVAATESTNDNGGKPTIESTVPDYHVVTLGDSDAVKVIRYDVGSEPASFHHPLHWLLAGVLENAYFLYDDVLQAAGYSGSFQDALILFAKEQGVVPASSTDILLPIFDFPIRTIVFASQIVAGVWVRNGVGMKSQEWYYIEVPLRENTYDADIFLVQTGFATIDPAVFLMTIVDRFGLCNWFRGDKHHDQYDTTQTLLITEDLLNLLIVCVGERSNMCGLSLNDKIQREIIHYLALRPSVFSDLMRRMPERMTKHPDFDHILQEVSHLVTDGADRLHDEFTLKDEYYDQIDPFFWHYTRNHREEADEVLRKRWCKSNPGHHQDEFFYMPNPIPLAGPFRHLGQFLHTGVFVHIMAASIWNIHTHEDYKSDTILDQVLHLILFAMKEPSLSKDNFYHLVYNKTFPFAPEGEPVTLIDLLMTIRGDDRYKKFHQRIGWVLETLMSSWPEDVRRRIEESVRWQALQSGSEPEISDFERKKRLARERQQRIKNEFAQEGARFLEQNMGLYDDEDEDGDEDDEDNNDFLDTNDGMTTDEADGKHRIYPYPTGSCLFCQEDVNERSKPYGLLGFLQASNIWREAPMDDPQLFTQMMNMGPNLDVDWPDFQCTPNAFSGGVTGFPSKKHKSGLYVSICGHLMHIKCFESYCASIDSRHTVQLTRNHPENRARKEFTCPLCKSLGNVLLPVFWKHKKESYPCVLPALEDDDTFATFLRTEPEQIMTMLKQDMGITTNSSSRRTGGASSSQKHASSSHTTSTSKLRESIVNWVPGIRYTMSREEPSQGQSLVPSLDLTDSIPPRLLSESSAVHGRLGVFDDTLHQNAINNIPAIHKSYTRLMDVMSSIIHENFFDEKILESSSQVKHIDLLWGAVGYTLSSVEIATRGQALPTTTSELPLTGTFYDLIPKRTQLLLRMACDTAVAYPSLMVQQSSFSTSEPSFGQVNMLTLARWKQVFVNSNMDYVLQFVCKHPERMQIYDYPQLLQDSPFMILVEWSLHLIPFFQINVYPLMRVLLLAELTRIIVGLGRPLPLPPNANVETTSVEQDRVRSFTLGVMGKLGYDEKNTLEMIQAYGSTLGRLVKCFILPFLRRALLLMIVRFGLMVEATNDSGDEVDRILRLLHLPSFEDLLSWTVETDELVTGWCQDHIRESERQGVALSLVSLDLPTSMYLVTLPQDYNRLLEEGMRRVCNNCGTIPTQPAVCLLCGTFVCFQSHCCDDDEYGECNLHMDECGGDVGIYLAIKQCTAVLLHGGNGCFVDAPYVDSFGEYDRGLKRNKLLRLKPRNYEEIRQLWLQHTIPIRVARHIEGTFDVGGWTTL